MKDNLYRLKNRENPMSLMDVLEKHKNHLEENELIIQLDDGTCKIQLDPNSAKYQVLVDHYDEKVNSTIENFLK